MEILRRNGDFPEEGNKNQKSLPEENKDETLQGN
jgi:hypothetical protein